MIHVNIDCCFSFFSFFIKALVLFKTKRTTVDTIYLVRRDRRSCFSLSYSPLKCYAVYGAFNVGTIISFQESRAP